MPFSTYAQGEPLKLTTPLNFLSTKSLYNFGHLEKFWASFDGILYSENLGGSTLAADPVDENEQITVLVV